jgi:hypothetical protein
MTVKDDMDHSNMHHASIYRFFHRFCDVFASDPVFSTYVYAPRVGPDLDAVLSAYNSAGLPGCVGSMDVVHVAWDKCPAAWFNLHCGRYGHPTVAFNCIVDNSLFFRGVCKIIIPFAIFWELCMVFTSRCKYARTPRARARRSATPLPGLATTRALSTPIG